ncbi:MAG: Eco57I restriction-modification methylase domain-containing protein [Akkermansia sp.]|nr:Eco57I restriction-modification methylase domain-containing protein [Akkermansia sp.]
MSELQTYLSQPYNGFSSVVETIFRPIFHQGFQQSHTYEIISKNPALAKNANLLPHLGDDNKNLARVLGVTQIINLGNIVLQNDIRQFTVYDVTIDNRINLARNRKGIQTFIRKNLNNQSCAFIIFHYGEVGLQMPYGSAWRISFCEIGRNQADATVPTRYTFLLGPSQSCKTAATRIGRLETLNGNVSVEDIRNAFSVEAVSDEFFGKYKQHYRRFVQYITGLKYSEQKEAWLPIEGTEPQDSFQDAFKGDAKGVRDYIKKMMGRITFLHFLQRKGWMRGDLNYMQNLYRSSDAKANFLDAVLKPLFYGILNTKETDRKDVFIEKGWDETLLDAWENIPYLNGGLFELDGPDAFQITFPQEYFEDLFEFFSEYNFTIDENDPNDAEVGVDPEMMGKIFENLLEDNKEKGAFYTPKEIVQYMCHEALAEYLHRATGDECNIENLRDFIINPDDFRSVFSDEQVLKLKKALTDVKICDPAIGSGAFPMELLNLLLRCRETLTDEDVNRAELKKCIIRNNIYGVDIEKGAVDIARLRFWLSIIVDEDEPSPLPNLDYKIMLGDSLRESYMGCDLSRLGKLNRHKNSKGNRKRTACKCTETQGEFLFDQTCARDKIQNLIHEYYDQSDHAEKQRINNEISQTIREYIKYSGEGTSPEILQSLDTMDIPNNQFFLWHIYFGNVLDSGNNPGFDIILGNPPYINFGKERGIADLYDPIGFETFARTGDIYCLFYEQGCNLLKDGGLLCYITSNSWLTTEYGESLKGFLAKNTNPQLLIDCAGYRVFKNATVDTNILLFSKEENQGRTTCIKSQSPDIDCWCDLLNEPPQCCSFMYPYSWVILNTQEKGIMQKMNEKGTPLSDWKNVHNHYGIKTGCNPAFIITSKKRDEILQNCPSDAERRRTEALIHPIIFGRHIKHYYYNNSNKWLINTHNGYLGNPRVHIEDYPTLKAHLDEHFEKIAKRADMGDTPYNLRSCAYMDDFFKPKIVYGQFQDSAEYSFAEAGVFVSSNEYIIVLEGYSPKCMLAFLNSKPIEWFLSKVAGNLGNRAKIVQRSVFQRLPIPKLDENLQAEFDKLVDSLIKDKGSESAEKKINDLVAECYELTPEEKEVVCRVCEKSGD